MAEKRKKVNKRNAAGVKSYQTREERRANRRGKKAAETPKAAQPRPFSQRQPRVRRARREHSMGWLYSVISTIVMAVCVTVACLMFFQVETVTVEGDSRYTDSEIIAAAGIEQGQNLFLMNRDSIASSLEKSMPYLKTVTIRRTLPGSVCIQVTEGNAVAALVVANGYWYIDENGKLLELSSTDNDLPHISGLSLVTPTTGTVLSVDSAYRLKKTSLISILTALTEQELLEDVISIDLSDGSQLVMQYTQKYTVRIPYGADFDYRIRAMKGIIDNLTETNDLSSGVIDMTLESEWHFIPE